MLPTLYYYYVAGAPKFSLNRTGYKNFPVSEDLQKRIDVWHEATTLHECVN